MADEAIFFMSTDGEKVPVGLSALGARSWGTVPVRQLRQLISAMAAPDPDSVLSSTGGATNPWHPRVPRPVRQPAKDRRHTPPDGAKSDPTSMTSEHSGLSTVPLSSKRDSAGGEGGLPLRLGGLLLENGRELGYYK